MKKIFISHSTKDRELIDSFLDFLESGMGVNREEVYCTSVDGTIGTGQKFVDNIKLNIEKAEIVMFIVTPQYLQSKFCLAEMGAAWVLNQQVYPIIFEPLNFDVLEGTPLKGIQAKILNSENNICSMYDELKVKNIASDRPLTLFNRKSKVFLSELRQITSKITVNEGENEEIDNLNIEIDKLLNHIDIKENKIKELNKYISDLEKIKDKENVSELKKEKLDNYNKFEDMVHEISIDLNKFSPYVSTCIFVNEFRNEEFMPNHNKYPLCWDEIQECVMDGILEIDGNFVWINDGHSSIDKLVDKLNKLEKFIEDLDIDTYEILINEYNVESLDMKYRPFWIEVLGQKINI